MKTTMAIADDLEFEDIEDGYMTLGPLKGKTLSEVERKMKKHGVFAFSQDCTVMQDVRGGGDLHLTVISDVVTGYLLDEDNAEAPSSDVEAFFLDLLGPDEEVILEGSYPDGCGGMIINQARYRRVGVEVLADIDRNRFDAEGKRTELCSIIDLHEHEIAAHSACSGNVVCLGSFRRQRAA